MSFKSKYISDLITALKVLDLNDIDFIINEVESAISQNKNIFMCGNGGSAANPSHSAGDWSKEIGARTHCLTDNTASVTSWANDLAYSKIFSSQLETYYDKGDLLLAFSGSGNSPNVIDAVDYVNNNGGISIGFTGNYKDKKGGKLAQIAQYSIVFETKSMEIIEDLELIISHIIKNSIKLNQGKSIE